MKKTLYLLPLIGLLMSCTGEKKQSNAPVEVNYEQTEALEASIDNLDAAIESSELEIEQTQKEIDSLLDNL
ncbi:hypothetical protein ES711_11445 [Gelidibacter salicanalis]|uniref:Uncharacterized protein n=1 Tax=Gelidibacter salicanalis TaxID=291193 RepID=A0A5C7AHA1_9FLAO|nr:hypothetical protein [Gelidibacter salicanalis]TXE07374.1 hypothetical protein ES711_11445 [Gelidibacter salicanalis]